MNHLAVRQANDQRVASYARRVGNESAAIRPAALLFFLGLHLPLAVIMAYVTRVATLHALLTLGLGLIWTLLGKNINRVAYAVAYTAGAEVLWRVTQADVFWEFGKYANILILGLAIIRFKGFRPADKKPIVYFAFLIPSILLLPAFDREAISFNLSGPLSLAMATMFFSKVTLRQGNLKKIFLALLAPIVGLGFLIVSKISVDTINEFTMGSAKAYSAGFGPNQVSSILGLGSLAAFFFILIERQHKINRVIMIFLAIWLLGQSMLTFSRGGLWTTVIAVASGAFLLLRDRRSRVIFIISSLLILLLGYFVVLPFLDSLTGGLISERFSDTDPTGRDLIIKADWIAFQQHPLFGVGPGQSWVYHSLLFRLSSAHTEYSRLLAEHGSLGLLALVTLLLIAAQRLLSKRSPLQKAYTISFTVWTLAYMLHSAMRLVAPSIMFGLASASLVLDKD